MAWIVGFGEICIASADRKMYKTHIISTIELQEIMLSLSCVHVLWWKIAGSGPVTDAADEDEYVLRMAQFALLVLDADTAGEQIY